MIARLRTAARVVKLAALVTASLALSLLGAALTDERPRGAPPPPPKR